MFFDGHACFERLLFIPCKMEQKYEQNPCEIQGGPLLVIHWILTPITKFDHLSKPMYFRPFLGAKNNSIDK